MHALPNAPSLQRKTLKRTKNHFKDVLEPFYSGPQEVRSILNRLIPIRNKLSHGNTISIYEAEQCLCYTDDFISAYKEYYVKLGKERDYNVPTFTRIKDSLGNDIIRPKSTAPCSWEIFCTGVIGPKIQLRSGDHYKLWVEMMVVSILQLIQSDGMLCKICLP